jgi:hypothetical protein
VTDTTAPAVSSSAQADEQSIRERVRELSAQMLTSGRLDAEGVTEVARAMTGAAALPPALDTGDLRRGLAELALRAQRVGAGASVRFAQAISAFAIQLGGSTASCASWTARSTASRSGS